MPLRYSLKANQYWRPVTASRVLPYSAPPRGTVPVLIATSIYCRIRRPGNLDTLFWRPVLSRRFVRLCGRFSDRQSLARGTATVYRKGGRACLILRLVNGAFSLKQSYTKKKIS